MRAFEALEAKAQGLQAKPGAMSEMSETQSLELQMTMDRMSKLLETMSNIMKKMSDTGSSIRRSYSQKRLLRQNRAMPKHT